MRQILTYPATIFAIVDDRCSYQIMILNYGRRKTEYCASATPSVADGTSSNPSTVKARFIFVKWCLKRTKIREKRRSFLKKQNCAEIHKNGRFLTGQTDKYGAAFPPISSRAPHINWLMSPAISHQFFFFRQFMNFVFHMLNVLGLNFLFFFNFYWLLNLLYNFLLFLR